MNQTRSGVVVATHLGGGIKRAIEVIGIFTDSKAYKDEIVRYESEVREKSRDKCEPEPGIDEEESDAVTL